MGENREPVTSKWFKVKRTIQRVGGRSSDGKEINFLLPGSTLVLQGHGWEQPEPGVHRYIHVLQIRRNGKVTGSIQWKHTRLAWLVEQGWIEPQP